MLRVGSTLSVSRISGRWLFVEGLLKWEQDSSIIFTHLWWQKWLWILPFCGGRERQFVQFKNAAVNAWSYGNPLDHNEQKKYYLDHNARMNKIVPKDRLLVFNPQDGWEPLCKFLGKDVPSVAYPRAGVRGGFHRSMAMIWRRAIMKAARNAGTGAFMLALVVIAVRKYWRGNLPVIPYSLLRR